MAIDIQLNNGITMGLDLPPSTNRSVAGSSLGAVAAVSAETADVNDHDGDGGLSDLVHHPVAADVHPAHVPGAVLGAALGPGLGGQQVDRVDGHVALSDAAGWIGREDRRCSDWR